jgi:predicted ArsR family transcriptional regulator
MPRPSLRANVFALLDGAGREGLTVGELAAAVPCTTKTARAHLSALLDDGTCRRDLLEGSGDAGRPPFVYFLAKHGNETVA